MSFGVRAHDFGKGSARELSSRIALSGASYVQLAPMKALEGFPPLEELPLSTSLVSKQAKEIRDVFERKNLRVSILGCYFNLVHPDDKIRQIGIQQFQKYLKTAKHFGTTLVGTETGSMRADYGPDPANAGEIAFKTCLETLEMLVATAQDSGSIVCIEGVTHHVIYNPRRMQRVIQTIGSNHLAIVFDPVNLMTPDLASRQEALYDECFSLWGNRIAVIHLKDFLLGNQKITVVPAGSGQLDYPLLFRYLNQLGKKVDLILENCPPDRISSALIRLKPLLDAYALSV
ncbi:MAG: sugar phosphate isomerase/epimerase [Spirochaetales bacterium]